jgi:hypothetical protein
MWADSAEKYLTVLTIPCSEPRQSKTEQFCFHFKYILISHFHQWRFLGRCPFPTAFPVKIKYEFISPYACYTSLPSWNPSFDQPNNSWRHKNILTLIQQFPSSSLSLFSRHSQRSGVTPLLRKNNPRRLYSSCSLTEFHVFHKFMRPAQKKKKINKKTAIYPASLYAEPHNK